MRFIRRRQSVLIALTVALALGGWLLSGQFGDSAAIESSPTGIESESLAPMSVRVRDFEARPVTREVVFSARTAPAREITIGAPSTQWWTQLATAIAGGLAFATVLTLVLTPCLLLLGEKLFGRTPVGDLEDSQATSLRPA